MSPIRRGEGVPARPWDRTDRTNVDVHGGGHGQSAPNRAEYRSKKPNKTKRTK